MSKRSKRNRVRADNAQNLAGREMVMTETGFEPVERAVGQRQGAVHAPQLMSLSNQATTPKRGTRELLKLYTESPWLRAIVNKIGRGVAETDWMLYAKRNRASGRYVAPENLLSRSGNVRENVLKRELEMGTVDTINDHPLLDLLATGTGNPRLNGFAALQVTQSHIDLVGEAFWLLEPGDLGVPKAYWPLPPSWISNFPTEGNPYFELNAPGGMTVRVPVTMIIPFIDADPENPYGRGSGIAKSLDDEIQIDEFAAKHQKSFFLNRARPDIIVSGQFISPKDAERLEKQWLSDHQGFWKCHDEQTEALTKDGWKLGTDITKNDLVATWNEETQCMEYQHPTDLHSYDVDGEMHHWQGQKMDALVTTNHGMWIRLGQNSDWRREESSQAIGRSTIHLRHAGIYSGNVTKVIIPSVLYSGKGRIPAGLNDELEFDAVAFAKLVGFIVSEGHVENTRVSVGQSKTGSANKPAVIEAMANALNLMEGFVTLSDNCNVYEWRITHKGFATWAIENIGRRAVDKHLPKECFEWPLEAKLELLNSLVLGDGQWRSGSGNSATYWTISRQLADDVQRLAIECGYRTTVRQAVSDTPSGKLPHYRLAITKQPLSKLQRGVTSWPKSVHYKGKVWCVTVPNGTMFTRRNGQVLLSGNSFKPLFFSQKIDVKELSQTFESMQMVQVRKQERDTFVSVFGAPPEKFGIIGESKRSTIAAADYFWNKDLIRPRAEMIRRILQQVLVPMFDERLLLYYDTPVIQDEEFQLNAMTKAPFASTVNEWRKVQKQESLGPAGDVLIVPMNMQIIPVKGSEGQAITSPQEVVEESLRQRRAHGPVTTAEIDTGSVASEIARELESVIEASFAGLNYHPVDE